MKPFHFLSFMDKIRRLLFSLPCGVLVGLGTVAVLAVVIVSEDSIQPYKNHKWGEDILSPPLVDGVEFAQALEVPAGLAQQEFLLAVFFGSKQANSEGSAEITLVQGELSQRHIVENLAPRSTLRKRFLFSGFAAAPAVLTIEGMPGNSEVSPGILCIAEGEGPAMEGALTDQPLYVSVDWFKVVPGRQKLSLGFPSMVVALLWLVPFAGLISFAWVGLGVAKNPRLP